MANVTNTFINQITTAIGQYVDVKKDELVEEYMTPSVTEGYMRTVMSEAQEGEEVAIPNDHLGEVVQNFQPVFTGKGDWTTNAEKIKQRRHKVNIPIFPDSVVGKYEGYLYDEKKTRAEMPLVAYILNKIPAAVGRDKEEQMVFKGSYVAPVAGTASPAANSVDGLLKIQNVAAAAGKYSKSVLGDFDADETFEYVENFFASIPEAHRYKKMKVFMSEQTKLNYQKDKRATFQYFQDLSQLLKIDFSNLEIVSLPSMVGSKRIFACPDGNLVRILHKLQGAENIEALREDYLIKLMADWHTAYGIADYRHFWSNDQN
jgi:hypothetical protein